MGRSGGAESSTEEAGGEGGTQPKYTEKRKKRQKMESEVRENEIKN